MRSNLNSENEIKIFILYIMNQIGHSINYDDIANMIYESGYIGYFDFSEVFSKLLNSQDIEQTGEKIYKITQRGKAIAENLEHLIPVSSKTKGMAIATRYSDLKKAGMAHSYTLEESEDGYQFECAIKSNEKNSEIFHVSLLVKDKFTAEKIVGKFKDNPTAVYRGVYAMFTGDADFLF